MELDVLDSLEDEADDFSELEPPEQSSIYSMGETLKNQSEYSPLLNRGSVGGLAIGTIAGCVAGSMTNPATQDQAFIAVFGGANLGAVAGFAAGTATVLGTNSGQRFIGDTLQNISSNTDQGNECEPEEILDTLHDIEDSDITIQVGDKLGEVGTEEAYEFIHSLAGESSNWEIDEYAISAGQSENIEIGLRAAYKEEIPELEGIEKTAEADIGLFADNPDYDPDDKTTLADQVAKIQNDTHHYDGHR